MEWIWYSFIKQIVQAKWTYVYFMSGEAKTKTCRESDIHVVAYCGYMYVLLYYVSRVLHASWTFLVLQQQQNLGRRFVVDFLFVTPIVGVCNCFMFCCTLLYVHSSIAIILMGKRELIALLNLSSWCLVTVERLFLAVPRGCLQFVIVVFWSYSLTIFRTALYNLFLSFYRL